MTCVYQQESAVQIAYLPEYTNILKSTQSGMIIGYHVSNLYSDSCSME
jgi:hypothetical protein